MGKIVARAGQWFVALLLWPLRLGGRALRQIWHWLGLLGIRLRRALTAVWQPLWRFTGRLGLALRHLLTWTIWRPLAWLATTIIALGRAAWRFTGRLGLALRNLLTWFLWRPLLFITAPLRWLYRKLLRRPLAWSGRLLWTLLRCLGRQLIGRPLAALWLLAQGRWQATAPTRQRWRRRLRSRHLLLAARLRLLWQRPSPPRQAIQAPPIVLLAPPRASLARPVTALVAVAIVLVAGFITSHARDPEEAAAEMAARSPAADSTATATAAAPLGELLALPTVEIQLTPWPTPDPLAVGGSMAFTWRRNGNSDIYLLAVGQSEPIPLISHAAQERNPAWSPDGRQLAFASNRAGSWNIYVLDLPSGAVRRVTPSDAFDDHPSWSPDGQWLVYESFQHNNLDIYITRSNGEGAPIRLTSDPAPDFSPAWSPDGRHIAFTSWRNGNKDIFIIPLDAASERTALNVTASLERHEDQPAFTPDGRYLAYFDNSSGFDLIYAVPLENYRPAGPPISIGQGQYPAWSADSRSLAYIHSFDDRDYLIATGLDAWSVAPQLFSSHGRISDLSWSAVSLPPPYLAHLEPAPTAGKPLYVEDLSEPEAEGAPYLLRKLPVNAPSPYLSDRVDQSFLALRQRVIAEAGWDFLGQLDNIYERPDARPLPGQSNKTWNKAGRAFDFYFRYVLSNDPQVEIVREERGAATFWRVYLRTARQDGTQGEPLRDLPWDFSARFGFEPRYYDQGGKTKEQLPSGYYLDFTALAADYGWSRVPAADNWRTYFPGIRFWHFQNRQGLTWEEAMLEIYNAAEIGDLLEQR